MAAYNYMIRSEIGLGAKLLSRYVAQVHRVERLLELVYALVVVR